MTSSNIYIIKYVIFTFLLELNATGDNHQTRDRQVYFAFINLFLCLCTNTTHSHSNLALYSQTKLSNKKLRNKKLRNNKFSNTNSAIQNSAIQNSAIQNSVIPDDACDPKFSSVSLYL